MSDILIITESKTKAERIKSFHPGVETTSTGGSIAEADFKATHFEVSPLPEAVPVIKEIIRLSRGKDTYLAADYDREGELIALACKNFLSGVARSVSRVHLASMSETDCLAILDTKRDINLSLAYSAILRNYLDRETGINYSRKISEKLNGDYKVGRVQVPLTAHLLEKPFNGRFPAYPPATADVLGALSDKGLSIRDAMGGLQQNYEKGLLSYIRTDSNFLPRDALESFAREIGWDNVQVKEPDYEFEQLAHSCIYSFDYGQNRDEISVVVDGLLYDAACGVTRETNYREHTEGELVRYMRSRSLARPSTYVNAVEAVIRNGYGIRSENALSPTDKGKKLLDLVRAEFPFLEFMTRPMERILSSLETGKISISQAMSELKQLEGLEAPLTRTR